MLKNWKKLGMANVTKRLFIPCGHYTTGTHSQHEMHDVVKLAADADQLVYFNFHIPNDFVSFSSLKVVWTGEWNGTPGNDWVCSPLARYGADSESSNIHTENPGYATLDVAAKKVTYETDVGFTVASLAKGDYVGIQIKRVGTDEADTYEQAISIYGLLLTYVARNDL